MCNVSMGKYEILFGIGLGFVFANYLFLVVFNGFRNIDVFLFVCLV